MGEGFAGSRTGNSIWGEIPEATRRMCGRERHGGPRCQAALEAMGEGWACPRDQACPRSSENPPPTKCVGPRRLHCPYDWLWDSRVSGLL